jgi:hypothetical protein
MSGQWAGGKGSARRPEDYAKISANWDRIFERDNPLEVGFWEHDCVVKGELFTALGEECSWCGKKETDA